MFNECLNSASLYATQTYCTNTSYPLMMMAFHISFLLIFSKKNVCKNVEAGVEFDSKSFNPRQKIFVSPRENELFPASHEEMWHGWTLPRGGGGRGRRRRRAGLVPGHPAGTGPGTERAPVPKSRRPTTEVTTELIREE